MIKFMKIKFSCLLGDGYVKDLDSLWNQSTRNINEKFLQ